ncbi:MAG: RnfABCDGE type electron transport complex subunit A [Treponema sp.]|jgi:electron transport complex protein RnfA|nr:RnfABCDGE type electron transport complex subunit A [Treponema sp.]MEE1211823.1 RnfABCDGE type electron transport complex subunit A [Treponema sp.]
MTDMLQLLIKSAIIDNVVFIQYLAICPFVGMTSDTDKAAGMGIATSFVIVLATAVTWPIYKLVMVPLGLEFLQTLFFILVIASLVQLVEFFLKKSIPALYKSMGVYLALITTNCAVLGVTINCISKNYNYGESLVYAVGSAAGFLLSMVVMAGVRERIKIASIPQSFKGSPILYVAAGLLSLAFMGFKGLIK